MRISLCLPSRGRPERLRAMMLSALTTASDPDAVETVAVIDNDDPACWQYAKLGEQKRDAPRLLFGSRRPLSNYWNAAAQVATGDVLMLCADDLLFRTEGWDEAVRKSMADEPNHVALVYADDGHAGERMATHPFVHRNWIDAVGRFTSDGYVSDYADLDLYDIGKRAGLLRYLPDHLIEHMHYSLGKSEEDATTRERLAQPQRDAMPAKFACEEGQRLVAAERLWHAARA